MNFTIFCYDTTYHLSHSLLHEYSHMLTRHKSSLNLLLLGIGPRLGAAIVVITILWMGFHWATSSIGAL